MNKIGSNNRFWVRKNVGSKNNFGPQENLCGKKNFDKKIFGQKSVGSRENVGSKKFCDWKKFKGDLKRLGPYIFFMSIKMLVQNNFGVCWVQRECWVQNILRLKIIGIQ